jgi:hypothetical protein
MSYSDDSITGIANSVIQWLLEILPKGIPESVSESLLTNFVEYGGYTGFLTTHY